MGQEIVYCAKCANRLLTSDFEKGRAFKIASGAYCAVCAKEILDTLPENQRKAILEGPRDPRRTSSPRLAALPSPGALPSTTPRGGSRLPSETPRGGVRLTTDSSTRIKTTVRRLAPPPSRARLLLGLGAAAAILVAVFAVLSRPAGPAPTAPPPAPAPPPFPPPPAPATPADPRAASAQKAFQEALDFLRANPADLSGQLERFRRARREAEGTPLQEEIQGELDRVQKKIAETLAAEVAPLETRAWESARREEFGQAVGVLEGARPRFALPEWSGLLEERIRKIHEEAWKTYAPLREEALKARRAGSEERVREISARIARWGLSAPSEDLGRALSAEPPTAPSPVPPLAAYRKAWDEALAPLAWRDYGEAIRLLRRLELPAEEAARAEHARDLENLESASALLSSTLRTLSEWPAGRSIRLKYRAGDGEEREVEGPPVRADAQSLEFRTEGGPVTVPLPEISAASLVEIHRGRAGARPEEDRRAEEAFLALEGGEEAARALGDKYADRARRLARERPAAEREAARLFWTAEDEFASIGTRAAALEKYHGLLAAHAETAFVRRNHGLIAARAGWAEDYFFHPHDLVAAGSFGLAPGEKVPSFQLSASDSPPGGGKDNYVEFSFYHVAEAAPRCWVYAGACCAETFTFYAQVTDQAVPHPSNPREMIAAGPGDNASALVKNPLLFLKRLHSMHGGPKQPERWAWFEVPLPKFPSPGIKTVRILSEQQGFAVAYALVSAKRKSFPADAEMREILKAHAALLPAPPPAARTGTILREYWTGIGGVAVEDLLKNPRFPDRPSGTSQETALEGPADFANDYGTRLRGFLHPPQTGPYTFWIAGDDQYELWLSTDDRPENRRKIAWGHSARNRRDWCDEKGFRSDPVPLAGGRRYYVEVLHKDGTGSDHVSVGWRLPDGSLERPIPGTRLSPWGGPPPAPPAPALLPPGRPRFWRAINFNGPPLTIDGQAWEGRDAPNFFFQGEQFEHQGIALDPPTDESRARMIRSSVWNRNGSNVKLTAVPNGVYQVYLYVWEDSHSQTFDLMVNGKVVLQRYSSGKAGHWDRLGPWTVAVTDGTLEVRATPGDANFSGIEVWRLR